MAQLILPKLDKTDFINSDASECELNWLRHAQYNWRLRYVIYFSNGGNMFGGSAEGIIIQISKENTEVIGHFQTCYNIARGQNGNNAGKTIYRDFKDIEKYKTINYVDPKMTISIEGTSNTGIELLWQQLNILNIGTLRDHYRDKIIKSFKEYINNIQPEHNFINGNHGK